MGTFVTLPRFWTLNINHLMQLSPFSLRIHGLSLLIRSNPTSISLREEFCRSSAWLIMRSVAISHELVSNYSTASALLALTITNTTELSCLISWTIRSFSAVHREKVRHILWSMSLSANVLAPANRMPSHYSDRAKASWWSG